MIGKPQECGNSSYQPSDIPCERGNHAYLWGVLLFYGPLWVCVLACICCMIVIVYEVRRTHQRARRYTTAIGTRHSMNRSGADTSKVATQALLYSLSFIFTWMPSTLWSIAHWFNWSHYGLDLATACTEPLQGFWNLMIFLKSRPATRAKIRRICSAIFPCCISAPEDRDLQTSFVTGLLNRFSNTNISSKNLFVEQPDISGGKATVATVDICDEMKRGVDESLKAELEIDVIEEEEHHSVNDLMVGANKIQSSASTVEAYKAKQESATAETSDDDNFSVSGNSGLVEEQDASVDVNFKEKSTKENEIEPFDFERRTNSREEKILGEEEDDYASA